jgi:hypothetical protein
MQDKPLILDEFTSQKLLFQNGGMNKLNNFICHQTMMGEYTVIISYQEYLGSNPMKCAALPPSC